jgi:hypothetical protein
MQSSLISKVEKSRIYAAEHDRIEIDSFSCEVRGDNSSHAVSLAGGTLSCDCSFHRDYGRCSHTMAMVRIMNDLLPVALQSAHPAA